MPDIIFAALFTIFFPIYKALHKKRAYGRVEQHLEKAKKYIKNHYNDNYPLQYTTAQDVFKGIFWNALESYRGLARLQSTTNSIVYENEDIIRNAIAECSAAGKPIAAISIHQGAFELMHRSLCRYSENVHLITDSVGDSAFRDVLKELRSDPHLTEYHPEETSRLIRELFRTKGILAMVVDQGRHTKGNEVTLFGRPSTLYLRLPKKINDMGAGIVIFRTWTEYSSTNCGKSQTDTSNKHHKKIVIRFEKYYPPQYDATGNSPLVTEITSEIEKWLAEHPEQWSWNYHGNFVAPTNGK